MGLFAAARGGGRRKYIGESTLAEPAFVAGGIAPRAHDSHGTIGASSQPIS